MISLNLKKKFQELDVNDKKDVISNELMFIGELLKKLEIYPASIDLMLGDKKIALCHFANDVRTDYDFHGTEEYLNNLKLGCGYNQFFYTNTLEHRQRIRDNILKYGEDNPYMSGYVSARDNPIFEGKTIDYYDTIIQGHVHKNLYEKYGFHVIDRKIAPWGSEEKIYMQEL